MLHTVTDDYLRRYGIDLTMDHGVDNMAMTMSLSIHPGSGADARLRASLLPPSVTSRPLEGEAPTIDVAVGYSAANHSPILKLFRSRLTDLVAPNQ